MNLQPIILLLFVVYCCSDIASYDADYQYLKRNTTLNTTQISEVLNRLVDPKTYDKRLRPKYGSEPVEVGITIHVSSISAVSEVDMDFTLNFYLRQTWRDPRLAFDKFDIGWNSESGKLEALTVGVDYLEKLWKPDTFFPNEKKSIFHVATTHNSFLRIEPDGTVFISQRLTVTATCPMVLHLFPMDSQKCKLEIESYGYTTSDIDYFWGKNRQSDPIAAVAFSDFSLPQFAPTGFTVNITKATTSSGVYVRLYFEVLLVRIIGFYILNIFVISILIVTTSWVSFWLNRESSPARTALGITTVLTMTTLTTTTNNAMPKVSYVKAIDYFLGFCFLMVFAALVEYAAVTYLGKRLKQKRKNKTEELQNKQVDSPSKRMPEQTAANSTSIQSEQSTALVPVPDRYSLERMMQVQSLGSPSELSDYQVECGCNLPQNVAKKKWKLWPAPSGRAKGARRTNKLDCTFTPSKIDKYSRVVFPVLFLCFNTIYWSVMFFVRDLEALQLDYTPWKH